LGLLYDMRLHPGEAPLVFFRCQCTLLSDPICQFSAIENGIAT
jgi:hypothetical protein